MAVCTAICRSAHLVLNETPSGLSAVKTQSNNNKDLPEDGSGDKPAAPIDVLLNFYHTVAPLNCIHE